MTGRIPSGPGHQAPPSAAAAPPWRCFHCDEVFTDREAAADHFGDGNYELEMPLCIEAATSELKTLVLTNREMFREWQEVQERAVQAEYERDCWASGARKFMNAPHATWHDLGNYRESAEGRILAAEAAINAAPRWLAQLLRRRAERLWRRAHTKESANGEG